MLLVASVALLVGCSTTKETTTSTTTTTLEIKDEAHVVAIPAHRDSVVLRDSVVAVPGDTAQTVWVAETPKHKVRVNPRTREAIVESKPDTIIVADRDTSSTTVTATEHVVEKEPGFFEKFGWILMGVGVAVILAVAALLASKFKLF